MSGLHCNCTAHLYFLCDRIHDGIVHMETEWVAWNGGWFGCLMPLSGISHGNPSGIPPRAGDGSAAPWGGSAEGASDGFPPQLLFQLHSQPHSSASLCKLFESRVCLYTHLLSEWAACWQILAWVALWCALISFFFLYRRHRMFINNCHFKWKPALIHSRLCVWLNGIYLFRECGFWEMASPPF